MWQVSRSVPSGRLFHGQPELGNHLLAHDNFLDLAGDGHRKAVNKSDIARDLIMRDLTAAELADFLSGRILAVAQPYPGAQFLAIVQVGHTVDGGAAFRLDRLQVARGSKPSLGNTMAAPWVRQPRLPITIPKQ